MAVEIMTGNKNDHNNRRDDQLGNHNNNNNNNNNNILRSNYFYNNDDQHRKIWPILNRPAADNISKISYNNPSSNYHFPNGLYRSRNFLANSSSSRLRRKKIFQQFQNRESFHCSISRILIVAQFFGLLPVSGILSTSSRGLYFRRRSFRTIYATILALIMTVVAISSIIHMVRAIDANTFGIKGGFASATAGAVFYGNSALAALIFLWLSPRWTPLQNDWRAMESLIDRLGRPQLKCKFIIITTIVFLSALIEHILSMVKNTPNYRLSNSSKNLSFGNFIDEYSKNSHNFIISEWGYNIGIGIFLFIVSKIATFTWNFTDLFVMLISTGLAESFKILNKKMMSRNAVSPTIGEWKILRENYAVLSALVKRVDNDVSPIVLLSFANNLYFICLQLLNGISKPDEDGILNSIYFFGSFTFLVGRTVAVTLLAARINDQSRIALPVLYTCAAETYCVETQRLEHQLATDEIALSGLRFFSITRNFMLAVAGAIITYEVVLLQFNVAINHQ